MLYWLLRWVLVGPFLRLIFRVECEGRENIPGTGGGMLYANHPTNFDSLLIGLVTPRPIGFMAKGTLFEGKSPHSVAVRWVMETTHQIPVQRQAGRKSAEVLTEAVCSRLQAKRLVGIHPEGTCPPDGRLYRFRAGVGHIARRAQCVVIPVGITYGSRRWFSWRRPVLIRVGRPVQPHEYVKLTLNETLDFFTSRVQTLTGQTYVHAYAPAPAKRR